MLDIDFSDIDDTKIGSPSANLVNSDSLWVNKYRPKTIDDICLSAPIKNVFSKQIKSGKLVNCSLIGSAGIGKTSLALILANSLEKSDVLFVACASGDGKVDYINSKLVPFCQAASSGRKVVILDELDSASAGNASSFQKALRNVIEAYPDCAFVATANYQSNIIEPILSRMPPTMISYSIGDMVNRLAYIVKSENIKVSGDTAKFKTYLSELVKNYYPDMRCVINKLQAICGDGEIDLDQYVSVEKKDAIKEALGKVVDMLRTTSDPLSIRKKLNDLISSFASDGSGANELVSALTFTSKLFEYAIDENLVNVEAVIELADGIYKVEHSIDPEVQVFAFVLKLKQALAV